MSLLMFVTFFLFRVLEFWNIEVGIVKILVIKFKF